MTTFKTIKIIATAGLIGLNPSILLAGDIGVEGSVTATTFVGDGTGLTGVVQTEVDPQVGTLTADKWCKADSSGVVIQCNQDAPIAPIAFQLWVPKTGQTQCWDEGGTVRECADPSTGEDGEYQMGGRIVRLDEEPDWHLSFRANPRFTDNSDGTVTDNLTGLIWLKNANCIADNAGFDNDSTADDGRVTWQHSLDFVRGMNAGFYNCGVSQKDWRLPNFNELLSLTDPSQTDPALSSGHPFLGVALDSYWSSTTVEAYTQGAVVVYLNDSSVSGYDKPSDYYVWPVRAGQ